MRARNLSPKNGTDHQPPVLQLRSETTMAYFSGTGLVQFWAVGVACCDVGFHCGDVDVADARGRIAWMLLPEEVSGGVMGEPQNGDCFVGALWGTPVFSVQVDFDFL